jgi:hypothetical protein
MRSGENSMDSYFHAAMADQGGGFCAGKTFPQLTMSVWEDHFSDKELLYHFILSGVRSGQNFLGGGVSPPFNIPALFFSLFLILCFVFAAYSFNLRHIWFYSCLLACISPSFTNRITMLRPHVLSIGIMLLLCVWCYKAFLNRRFFLFIFAAGFLFAWTYSNPHFLLFPAFVFAVAFFKNKGFSVIAVPLFAALGILAGYVFHPQFPNTLYNWKIQCLDVVFQILSGDKAPVGLGVEVRPFGFDKVILDYALFFIFALNAYLLFELKKWPFFKLNKAATAFFIMSCVAVPGVFISGRALEYACPFVVMSFAFALREIRHSNFLKKHFLHCALPLLFILFVFNGAWQFHHLKQKGFMPPEKFIAWTKSAGFEDGILIANLCWSDFPVLFYGAPEYKYLSGMDPMFSYSRDPERMGKLEKFRCGFIDLTPLELAKLTDARFVYVSQYGWRLAQKMSKEGYPLVYNSKEDGFLFDLKPAILKSLKKKDSRP